MRDKRGASAAEFALILPLFLLFLLGIIDAGRYAWDFNRAEKATQIGARWAVVTDPIPQNLASHNFVSSTVPQGSIVPQTAFAGVRCEAAGQSATCACKSNNACGFNAAAVDDSAWDNLVDRMQAIYPDIASSNVVVDYDWSGLGYAGDPNGPDVSPLVTVRLRAVQFQPMTLVLFGGSLPIPAASYSLTMEDAQGASSN